MSVSDKVLDYFKKKPVYLNSDWIRVSRIKNASDETTTTLNRSRCRKRLQDACALAGGSVKIEFLSAIEEDPKNLPRFKLLGSYVANEHGIFVD